MSKRQLYSWLISVIRFSSVRLIYDIVAPPMAKIRYNPIIAENTWFVKSKTKFSGSRQQFYFGYHPKRWDYEKDSFVHKISVDICEQM